MMNGSNYPDTQNSSSTDNSLYPYPILNIPGSQNLSQNELSQPMIFTPLFKPQPQPQNQNQMGCTGTSNDYNNNQVNCTSRLLQPALYDSKNGCSTPASPLSVETPVRISSTPPSTSSEHPFCGSARSLMLENLRDQFPRPLYNSPKPLKSSLLSASKSGCDYQYRKKVTFASDCLEIGGGNWISGDQSVQVDDYYDIDENGNFIKPQKCKIQDYSEYTGSGSGEGCSDNDRLVYTAAQNNIIVLGRTGTGRNCGGVGVTAGLLPPRKGLFSCAPDLGIKCGRALDCNWTCGECCGETNCCNSDKCRITADGCCCERCKGAHNLGRLQRTTACGCCTKYKPPCGKAPYDCIRPLLRRTQATPEEWKELGIPCCLCNACKRAEWHCRNLKYSNCVPYCSREMRQCYWENLRARQNDFDCELRTKDKCGVPIEGNTWHKKLFGACKCGVVETRDCCKSNCKPKKCDPCCPRDGHPSHCTSCCYDPCIRRAFTCHGHGPLCSCSWLDKGETFKSQLRRCRCRKKGCPKCKCPIGFGDGVVLKGFPDPRRSNPYGCCDSGSRKRFSCSNAGCYMKPRRCLRPDEEKRARGFCEFTPPNLGKPGYAKPWRECMEWRDPCCIPKKKTDCGRMLGRFTVLHENQYKKDY